LIEQYIMSESKASVNGKLITVFILFFRLNSSFRPL